VQSRKLWATNIHYLNDFEEFKHGLEIGRRVVKRKLRTASGSSRALLERLETVGDQFGRVNIFVSSFTEEGDILSQWRGYSSAGGVSLGFIVSELNQIAARAQFRLIKCIYNDVQKEVLAEEFVDDALRRFSTSGDFSSDAVEQVAFSYMSLYLPIAAAFKNMAFREENEWRLISHLIPFDHPQVAVRATSTMLIPYFELSLDLGVDPKGNSIIGLEHVIVGPTREKINISNAVGFACSRYAVRNVGVTFSQAPYRSL
jgi:hypothetical protein